MSWKRPNIGSRVNREVHAAVCAIEITWKATHTRCSRYHQGGPIMKKLSMLGIIVGAALLTTAPVSLQWSQKNVALSLDSADARVGRPLTATSVAGVNRRVHRRAYRRAVY